MALRASQKIPQPLKSSSTLGASQGLNWMKRERKYTETKRKEAKKTRISFSPTTSSYKHYFRGWEIRARAISNKIQLANPAGQSMKTRPLAPEPASPSVLRTAGGAVLTAQAPGTTLRVPGLSLRLLSSHHASVSLLLSSGVSGGRLGAGWGLAFREKGSPERRSRVGKAVCDF